jgi:hypothetical protein
MALPFRKASSAAASATGIAKLRARRADLEKQLTTLQTNIDDQQQAIERALIDGDSDSEIAKAEAVLAGADRRAVAIGAALAAIDQQIAAQEHAIAEAERKALAEKTAAELRSDLSRFNDDVTTFVEAARKVAPSAEKLGVTVWGAREINELARIIANEVPTAQERVAAETEGHISQLLDDARREVPPTPAPAPIDARRDPVVA